jgi:hypothetical protein
MRRSDGRSGQATEGTHPCGRLLLGNERQAQAGTSIVKREERDGAHPRPGPVREEEARLGPWIGRYK